MRCYTRRSVQARHRAYRGGAGRTRQRLSAFVRCGGGSSALPCFDPGFLISPPPCRPYIRSHILPRCGMGTRRWS